MGTDLNGKKLPKGITQRKDGSYRARFNYQGMTYCKSGRDLKTLKREIEDLRYEVKHGVTGKMDGTTIDEWFDVWINIHKSKSIKETTQIRYKEMYQRHIKNVLGKCKVADIKPLIIEHLLQGMAKNDYSTKTIRDVYHILSAMFKYAVYNRLIVYNPCDGVSVPKTKEKEKRVLTQEEQIEVINHAKGRLYGNMVVAALGTGMRAGELLGLTWNDIDFDQRIIIVNKTLVHVKDSYTEKYTFKYQSPKTKNGIRTIPMQESVYAALKKQHIQLKEMQIVASSWEPLPEFNNLVFVGKNGKPITEHSFQTALDCIAKSINKERMKIANDNGEDYVSIPHFYPHALRHTFATRCFEAGIDAKVVQDYLGHSSITITLDTYTHVSDDKSKSEMNKLENLYKAIS